MTSALTLVELGCHEQSRQSLIFGKPLEIIPCPMGYHLAVFEPGQTFGYERWRANDYGTTSWQFMVLRSCQDGQTNKVSGVYPGADILFRTRGKDATRRALNWAKSIRKVQSDGLENLPELAWRQVANDCNLRRDFSQLPYLARRAIR